MNKSTAHIIAVLLAFQATGCLAGSELVWEFDQARQAITEALPLPGQLTPEAGQPSSDLLVRVQVDYGQDRVVERVRHVIHFGNAEGVQQDGVVNVTWDSSQETLTFREVATIAPDGSIVRFSPADARITDDNSDDVFTDQKNAVLQLPALTSGSMAVLEYERALDRTLLPFPWQSVRFLQAQRPRHRYELWLRWQDDADAPAWHNGFPGQLSCDMAALRELRCVATDIAAFPIDPDVDYYDELPQFLASASATWDDIILQAVASVESAIAQDAGIRDTYQRLVTGLADQEAIIAVLQEFVARDIRYVSFSEGQHSVVPHPAADTLAKRFGDCKDKSVLLLAMLRMAGIDAHAALVSTLRNEPDRLRLPGAWYFDHMVICLDGPDGERCLDATDVYAATGLTAAGIQGKVKLDLVPGSQPTTVPADTYRWSMTTSTELAFSEQGDQRERQVRSYNAAYGAAMRSNLASRQVSERQRWVLEDYQSVVSNRVEPEFSLHGVDELVPTLDIASEAYYEDLVDPTQPLGYQESDPWLVELASAFRSGNKFYPYRFPGLRIEAEHTYVVPPGWGSLRPGAALALDGEYGSMQRIATVTANGMLQVTTVLEMPRRVLRPDELADFNGFIDLASQQSLMRVRSRGR